MKSQQRTNNYFVQFCLQVRTIYQKQKTMNYPDGAKRNVLSCFLTVSKVQFITLERSASGKGGGGAQPRSRLKQNYKDKQYQNKTKLNNADEVNVMIMIVTMSS